MGKNLGLLDPASKEVLKGHLCTVDGCLLQKGGIRRVTLQVPGRKSLHIDITPDRPLTATQLRSLGVTPK